MALSKDIAMASEEMSGLISGTVLLDTEEHFVALANDDYHGFVRYVFFSSKGLQRADVSRRLLRTLPWWM